MFISQQKYSISAAFPTVAALARSVPHNLVTDSMCEKRAQEAIDPWNSYGLGRTIIAKCGRVPDTNLNIEIWASRLSKDTSVVRAD